MKTPRRTKGRMAPRENAPRSMTGYGSARKEVKGVVIEAEIRSVNHRYLSLQYRWPNELAALEAEIDTLLRSKLQRGALTLSVQWTRKSRCAASIIDEEQAKIVAESLKQLARKLSINAEVNLAHVLAAPGVFVNGKNSQVLDEAAKELVISTVSDAVDSLVEARGREGAALAAELHKYIDEMRKLTALIEMRIPSVIVEYQAKLKRRLSELLSGSNTNLRDEDLAREVALLADRTDVSEEITRLRVHLDEASLLLGKREPVGRKFEFLTQEMLREVNTTGSKSADAETSKHVISMKTILERVREQIANLE